MIPSLPKPIKLFIGALYSDRNLLEKAMTDAEDTFSPIDSVSKDFPFTMTTYYDAEMSTPIFRRFYSFKELVSPDILARAKLVTNSIEDRYAFGKSRKVNLDVGYMDYDKIVLASAKYGIHKISIGSGIYADMALHYEKGNFFPYQWAFMDFQSADYQSFFFNMRTIYKRQLKEFHTSE
ncbi:MAG: DUF4416 family protein [Candidatus Marinimicrobia bacterium]|nr:DUF4416 family protein [Candidatus Neomarinimicrobiota bacterium]